MKDIEKIVSLQNEAIEFLKQEKIDEAISKMQEVASLLNSFSEESEKEEKEEENSVAKTVEAEVKKVADLYINGADFKNVVTQILEASSMFAKVSEIEKTLDELKKEANEETSIDPASVQKTEDNKFSVWEGL